MNIDKKNIELNKLENRTNEKITIINIEVYKQSSDLVLVHYTTENNRTKVNA